MRSDERFFFYLAAFCMTTSVVYTIFWHLLPSLEVRHNYVYAHCTVTGNGHWEKYETIDGIKERVVVPVEVRVGSIQGALDWNAKNASVLRSQDIYRQGISRDEPSGWQYFTVEDKNNYLRMYKPGKEYECWARARKNFQEAVFHKGYSTYRIIPQIVFVVIVIFLCMATGVCLGIMDVGRKIIGLPVTREFMEEEQEKLGDFANQKSSYGSVDPKFRQFSVPKGVEDREWV
mmetsp:Transcript_44078/g.139077  ORF Transcript_44078/g.139077 Transcript_44078/m.139077 type:complete len:232 (+) Transcript_44078:121-816(+)